MEPKEINLNNPIFVYYFDSSNMPRQRVRDHIDKLSQELSYTNITFFIVPADYTKIECVYNRYVNNQVNKLQKIIQEILLENPDNPSLLKFKEEIREMLINDILE